MIVCLHDCTVVPFFQVALHGVPPLVPDVSSALPCTESVFQQLCFNSTCIVDPSRTPVRLGTFLHLYEDHRESKIFTNDQLRQNFQTSITTSTNMWVQRLLQLNSTLSSCLLGLLPISVQTDTAECSLLSNNVSLSSIYEDSHAQLQDILLSKTQLLFLEIARELLRCVEEDCLSLGGFVSPQLYDTNLDRYFTALSPLIQDCWKKAAHSWSDVITNDCPEHGIMNTHPHICLVMLRRQQLSFQFSNPTKQGAVRNVHTYTFSRFPHVVFETVESASVVENRSVKVMPECNLDYYCSMHPPPETPVPVSPGTSLYSCIKDCPKHQCCSAVGTYGYGFFAYDLYLCGPAPLGMFASEADGITCVDCDNAPLHSTYTDFGHVGADCPWACDAGYFLDGTDCTQTGAGYYSPVLNNTSIPCNPLPQLLEYDTALAGCADCPAYCKNYAALDVQNLSNFEAMVSFSEPFALFFGITVHLPYVSIWATSGWSLVATAGDTTMDFAIESNSNRYCVAQQVPQNAVYEILISFDGEYTHLFVEKSWHSSCMIPGTETDSTLILLGPGATLFDITWWNSPITAFDSPWFATEMHFDLLCNPQTHVICAEQCVHRCLSEQIMVDCTCICPVGTELCGGRCVPSCEIHHHMSYDCSCHCDLDSFAVWNISSFELSTSLGTAAGPTRIQVFGANGTLLIDDDYMPAESTAVLLVDFSAPELVSFVTVQLDNCTGARLVIPGSPTVPLSLEHDFVYASEYSGTCIAGFSKYGDDLSCIPCLDLQHTQPLQQLPLNGQCMCQHDNGSWAGPLCDVCSQNPVQGWWSGDDCDICLPPYDIISNCTDWFEVKLNNSTPVYAAQLVTLSLIGRNLSPLDVFNWDFSGECKNHADGHHLTYVSPSALHMTWAFPRAGDIYVCIYSAWARDWVSAGSITVLEDVVFQVPFLSCTWGNVTLVGDAYSCNDKVIFELPGTMMNMTRPVGCSADAGTAMVRLSTPGEYRILHYSFEDDAVHELTKTLIVEEPIDGQYLQTASPRNYDVPSICSSGYEICKTFSTIDGPFTACHCVCFDLPTLQNSRACCS